jgi:hypothetical protein
VATSARQRGPFGLGTFWNEDATSGSREARDQRHDRQRCSWYVSTRASVATRVSQSGRNFGRASERCVSKRPQWGQQPGGRPGDWASDNLPLRSRPARCRSRPAQGHGPRSRRSRRRSRHSRRVTATTVTESGQRVRNPRRPGAAAFTRAGGWDKKQSIITSLTRLYRTLRGSCVTLKSCCLRCSASTCCPHLSRPLQGKITGSDAAQ